MSSIEPCESHTQTQLDFPIGWFSVARSRDIGKGEVQRVYAFDRELALFRTREGKAVVLDAFCPHLGAHMGVEGRVVGETLRCPFHGWQFGVDGACTEIPYCDEVPERARVRSWTVSETNGDIMVWYHPNEEAPLIQWSSLDTNGPPVLSGVLVTVELRTLADYQGSSLRAFCQAGEGYWESNLVEWGLCPG